jgi:hypothetical protein
MPNRTKVLRFDFSNPSSLRRGLSYCGRKFHLSSRHPRTVREAAPLAGALRMQHLPGFGVTPVAGRQHSFAAIALPVQSMRSSITATAGHSHGGGDGDISSEGRPRGAPVHLIDEGRVMIARAAADGDAHALGLVVLFTT